MRQFLITIGVCFKLMVLPSFALAETFNFSHFLRYDEYDYEYHTEVTATVNGLGLITDYVECKGSSCERQNYFGNGFCSILNEIGEYQSFGNIQEERSYCASVYVVVSIVGLITSNQKGNVEVWPDGGWLRCPPGAPGSPCRQINLKRDPTYPEWFHLSKFNLPARFPNDRDLVKSGYCQVVGEYTKNKAFYCYMP